MKNIIVLLRTLLVFVVITRALPMHLIRDDELQNQQNQEESEIISEYEDWSQGANVDEADEGNNDDGYQEILDPEIDEPERIRENAERIQRSSLGSWYPSYPYYYTYSYYPSYSYPYYG